MRHPWSAARCRHASPAGLSNAKSADLANGNTTQHSPTQRVQSAVSSTPPGCHRPTEATRPKSRPSPPQDDTGRLLVMTPTPIARRTAPHLGQAVGVLLLIDLAGGLLAV